MFRTSISLAAFAALSLSAAEASTVNGAVSVSGPSTVGGFELENTIDQSGLSIGYTSGVTDYDAYVAQNPFHQDSFGDRPFAFTFQAAPVNFDYDLGATSFLEGLLFWNYPFRTNSAGVIGLDVFVSAVSDFSVSSLVGSFTPADDGTATSSPTGINQLQTFDTVDADARYVRLAVTANVTGGTGFSEVAFRVGDTAPVPVPAALPLMLTGFAALGLMRRRRKQA